MSLKEFANVKYVKTMDNNEEVRLGSFSTGQHARLGVIRVNALISRFDLLTGSEQLKIKIYPDGSYFSSIGDSVYTRLNDIEFDSSDSNKKNFLGYIKFEFKGIHLNKNLNYYPTVTVENYNRADPFNIGLCYDFPDPIVDNGGANFYDHPIAMQIFTEKVT